MAFYSAMEKGLVSFTHSRFRVCLVMVFGVKVILQTAYKLSSLYAFGNIVILIYNIASYDPPFYSLFKRGGWVAFALDMF